MSNKQKIKALINNKNYNSNAYCTGKSAGMGSNAAVAIATPTVAKQVAANTIGIAESAIPTPVTMLAAGRVIDPLKVIGKPRAFEMAHEAAEQIKWDKASRVMVCNGLFALIPIQSRRASTEHRVET